MSGALGIAMLVSLTGAPAQASHDYDGMVPIAGAPPRYCNKTAPPAYSGISICQTDNSALYWYADSNDPGELEANDVDSVEDVLAGEYAPTDLSIHYDSTPVFSGSGETDLVLQEAEAAMPLPDDDYLGLTWCDDDVTGELYTCDQTYVRIASPDGFRIHNGSVACHEFGHAVGLVHGDDALPYVDPGDLKLGCMVNEDQFPSDLGPASTHLINLTY